ncbi:MAG TPA: MarR family winged helix-turn-helix transcriptional regulator [Burkholderiales bacterium]|nr:MarR family winged helix-turn-helix transcriptional regulator [Burkholderiales bacterium]
MKTTATTGRGKTRRPAPASAAPREAKHPLACTGARLRRVTRRVTAFYEHHMRASGLKLSQYSLLTQLSEEPQSLTALADRMDLDRTTLSRNLQPLMEQGAIAESAGADARQRLFFLTRAGVKLRTEARKQWRLAQLDLEQHLDPDFVARLHEQLELALKRLKPALPEDN